MDGILDSLRDDAFLFGRATAASAAATVGTKTLRAGGGGPASREGERAKARREREATSSGSGASYDGADGRSPAADGGPRGEGQGEGVKLMPTGGGCGPSLMMKQAKGVARPM